MKTFPITKEDKKLIDEATNIINKYHKHNKHNVGAAVKTSSGKIFSAVHLEANIGRIAVCAEPIAMGKAISEGENKFDTIVAVGYSGTRGRKKIQVIEPCGMCRELVTDYALNAKVIIPKGRGVEKVYMRDLLPHKA